MPISSGRQSALCFTTGYQTNLGAISALVGKDEHIFSDKLNHASIMDGLFLAQGMRGRVRVHRYLHNNMESLEKFLAEEPKDAPKLVVTDGVFSMEGDIVKLPRLKELCRAVQRAAVPGRGARRWACSGIRAGARRSTTA